MARKSAENSSGKRERAFRGDRLRWLREQMKMTQPKFEEFFGFGTGMISRYESGAADPMPPQLVEIARKLQVTTDWLLGLVDNPEGYYKADAQVKNPKEAVFLQRLRNGDFLRLIHDLSGDAIVPPPDEESKDPPKNMP